LTALAPHIVHRIENPTADSRNRDSYVVDYLDTAGDLAARARLQPGAEPEWIVRPPTGEGEV
jgi:hypothetical protein